MGGGAAGSGEVVYPDYLSQYPDMDSESWRGYHAQFLIHMTSQINAYLGSDPSTSATWDDGGLDDDISPYDETAAYDPTTVELPLLSANVSTFAALAAAYSGSTLWSAAVSAADAAGGNLDAIPDVDSRLATLVSAIRSVVSTQLASAESSAATITSSAIATALSLESGTAAATLIESAQEDYERGLMPAFYRSVNRFAGGMADINAVMSSSFVMGLAHLESQLQKEIAKFSTDLKLQLLNTLSGQYLQLYANLIGVEMDSLLKGINIYAMAESDYQKNRSLFLNQAVAEIMQSERVKYDLYKASADMATDYIKTSMVAKKEQIDKDIELDVLDARWPLETLLMGGNLVASISGAAHTVRYPESTARSAVAGAAGGVALGSMLTKVPNPYVMAAGAIIGAGSAFLD